MAKLTVIGEPVFSVKLEGRIFHLDLVDGKPEWVEVGAQG